MVGRLKGSAARFLANHGDPSALVGLATGVLEPIGRRIFLRGDGSVRGKNVFVFADGAKL